MIRVPIAVWWRAAPIAMLVAVLSAWGAVYTRRQREIGRLEVQGRTADSLSRVARAAAAAAGGRAAAESTRAAALERDTATANAALRAQERRMGQLRASYSAARLRLDSVLGAPGVDTTAAAAAVRAYAREADATVRACQDATGAADAALAACEAHGEALQRTLSQTRLRAAALADDTAAKALQIRTLQASDRGGRVWRWVGRGGWAAAMVAVLALVFH